MLCLAQARADGVQPCSRLWESCCLFERFGALRSKRLVVCLPRVVISYARDDAALNLANKAKWKNAELAPCNTLGSRLFLPPLGAWRTGATREGVVALM